MEAVKMRFVMLSVAKHLGREMEPRFFASLRMTVLCLFFRTVYEPIRFYMKIKES